MADMDETLRRFSAGVDAALTRARRAKSAADARAGDFRNRDGSGADRPTGSADDDRRLRELCSSARGFRQDNGLALPSVPGSDHNAGEASSLQSKPGSPAFDDGEDFPYPSILS